MIIAVLLIILLGVSSKYIELKGDADEVIGINAWNFAAGNHSILETLEYIASEDSYNGAI